MKTFLKTNEKEIMNFNGEYRGAIFISNNFIEFFIFDAYSSTHYEFFRTLSKITINDINFLFDNKSYLTNYLSYDKNSKIVCFDFWYINSTKFSINKEKVKYLYDNFNYNLKNYITY